MALIKCPECGRENVSDSAESCPECGYGVKAHFERKKFKELQKNKAEKIDSRRELKKQEFAKKNKYGLILSIFIIISGIVVSSLILYLQSDNRKYKDAQKFIESGLYSEAKNIFLSMEDNSTIEKKINECNYNIGKQLLMQEKYEDAIDILSMVYGYTDTFELINEAKYGISMDFFDSGNMRDAFEILYGFTDSGNYSEDIKRCIEQDSKAVFDFAEELYEDAQFENALEIFNLLNKSESSEELDNYIWYCEEYIKIQGYWYNERDKNKYVIVDGDNIEIHGSIISEATMEGYDNHIIGDGNYIIEPTILVNRTSNELYLKFVIDNVSKDVTISPPSSGITGSDSLGFTRSYTRPR